ncbi:MAG: glycosyltransferase, partial [Chitinophagaceae bacterium]
MKNKSRQFKPQAPLQQDQPWPSVTVQLPVYNEKYVVGRLIEAVMALDYPDEKLEVQILDDSTDETTDLIIKKIKEYKESKIVTQHFQRKDRKGYKAGALACGLSKARGEFIAIFDADFIPRPDFLKRTIPCFNHEKTGMVQTRWGHLNRDFSLLTRIEAFALDAHFTIEQSGRNFSGGFMNFNGTAGVWRKQCIIDAGGWQDDTLTEDLDLSYRAQLKGWRFKYLEEVVSPAELPPVMSAIKSQQYRWSKGGAETARKMLGRVLRSKQSVKIKWLATFHLLNTLVFPAVLFSSVCSVPLLAVPEVFPSWKPYFGWTAVFLFSFLIFGIFYYIVASQVWNDKNKVARFASIFPVFLAISMGLSLHNSVAVTAGWLGKKSAFIRTPKFNLGTHSSVKDAAYLQHKINFVTWLEGLLSLYFVFGAGYALYVGNYSLLP